MRTLYVELMELRALVFNTLVAQPRWRLVRRYALKQRLVALDLILDRIEVYLPLMYGQQDSLSQKHWSN